MSYTIGVKYFNSFWLKRVLADSETKPSWPGLPWFGVGNQAGYPPYPFGTASFVKGSYEDPCRSNFYLEETRIKGGFNNAQPTLGVRAYVVNENTDSTDRKHSLIYSGLLNTRTGFNQTNVFSIADPLVKDLDPLNGSIQKIYSEDTNLLVLQENKCSKVLINKNAIYSGDQGSLETNNVNVLGQDIPYLGEYGISTNPESFAAYGYRKYFADKDRAAILRLSRDGITEISGYGMKDYFRDNLPLVSDEYVRQVVTSLASIPTTGPTDILTTNDVLNDKVEIGAAIELEGGGLTLSTSSIVIEITGNDEFKISPPLGDLPAETYNRINFVTFRRGRILGSWDAHQSAYTISMQSKPRTITTPITPLNTPNGNFDTLGYDESINGWTSFYTYKPDFMGSLKNDFYSFIDSNVYQHYDDSIPNRRGIFYNDGIADSFIEFIFNNQPTVTKNFNTIAYEGSNGWEVDSYISDLEGSDNLNGTNVYVENKDITNSVKSYIEGSYDSTKPIPLTGAAALTTTAIQPILRVGFDRKENHYVANLVNVSTPRPGQIIGGEKISGVKGYIMTVKMSIDATTEPGGVKQLFSVSSNYVFSSR